MIESSSIDFSVANLFRCYQRFRRGKRRTAELERFEFNLETELFSLNDDLTQGRYRHGPYRQFVVNENKRRVVSVASVRDRVVHRLLYDYLVPIFDKTFIFDAWSCRKGKGLTAGLDRAATLTRRYRHGWFWRSDITKFFDSVDNQILLELLKNRLSDLRVIWLLKQVIGSFRTDPRERGLPIGNLTSQIFANIYLNELDHFVTRQIRPLAYLRYGDDFLIFGRDRTELLELRRQTMMYITKQLRLRINVKSDFLLPIRRGIRFLGSWLYPNGQRLQNRNRQRITGRLNHSNHSSYRGLVGQNENNKRLRIFDWQTLIKLNENGWD